MRRQLALTALLVTAALWQGSAAAQTAQGIKPGRWEFTSQMQMPNMPQLPPGTQLPPGVQMPAGGGLSASHTSCIDPERAVPTDPRPECKIDRMQRSGNTVNWSTTCTTAQGPVHSTGAAQYSGDTMQATVQTAIPQAGGRTMTTTQHIAGRYLGACAAR